MSNVVTTLSLLLCGLTVLSAGLVCAQESGEISYKVGRKAVISVSNMHGPITVKSSGTNEVRVKYISASKSVTFDHQKHGKRITLSASSDQPGTNLCEYVVLVPSTAFVTLFAGGAIHAESLAGDILLETPNSPLEVKNMTDAHVHIKTIGGQITLTSIHNSHVFVHSVNGSITILDAPDSWIEADADAGRIAYQGDPGGDGEYRLTTRSGDLELSIPASALAEIRTHSLKGQSGQDLPNASIQERNAFLKRGSVSRSHFDLRSFTGRIRVKRP